jgi:hypothetical protein
MTIVVLAIVALILAWSGRVLFGTWFNHASHYSLIWGVSLILFELRLIGYYRLEPETWIMIGSAWLAFSVGSFIVPLSGKSAGPRAEGAAEGRTGGRHIDPGDLRNAILILSAVALAAVIQHWMILIDKFGGILNVIVLGNVVYALRLSDGI